ncbi:MAG: FkbM family methyltransferase [Bacteroidota bacterium]
MYRVSSRFSKYLLLYGIRGLHQLHLLEQFRIKVKLFFGVHFSIDLPAHADIFLYCAKVSPSDLLLQQYLNNFLQEERVFFDIGASIGYYSLLVSKLLDNSGKIIAVEPSKIAFSILQDNTVGHRNIQLFNLAIGDANKSCTIHEFPTRYNEYNTLQVDDFIKGSKWFAGNQPTQRNIQMKRLDRLIEELNVVPDLIKVDIEGSEERLVSGMLKTLSQYQPDLIFRYWPVNRSAATQLATFKKLQHWGYEIYAMDINQKIPFHQLSDYKFEYLLLKTK